VKIAIIGAGFIGEIHAKAVQNHPLAELLAVVDSDDGKAKLLAEKFSIPHSFSSIDDLVKSQTVDAVVIGTPNFLHASQTEIALNAGLHVMVEKPMALSVQEAERMNQLSQETNRILMVAHCWRYDREVNWLREQVIQNKIGPIVRTKSYGIHENWGPAGWFVQKKLAGGGALMDMGIHAIDTARYILGDPKPVKVYAELNTHYGNYDVDDTGMIIIRWEGGAASFIETGWWQPYMDGPEAATQLFGLNGYGSVFPTQIRQTDLSNRKKPLDVQFEYQREGHAEQKMYNCQFHHFIDCVQEKKVPRSNGYQGIVNMKILSAAYESCHSGKVVDLYND
jgi:predicted dehydrogenase